MRAYYRLEPERGRSGLGLLDLVDIVGGPDALNAEVEAAGPAIRQADTDSADLLAQDLGLGLDDEAVVRADEVVPLDQHRLPLARPLGE